MNLQNTAGNDLSLMQILSKIRGQGITTDNYRSDNYEMACSYAKAIELTIKDKDINQSNYYEVEMCPHKNVNIDAYIICTTKKANNYGLQIKSGHNYDSSLKERLYHSRYRYSLDADKYLLMTWNKLNVRTLYQPQTHVGNEDIKSIIQYIEDKKDNYPTEYKFLKECFRVLKESNDNHNNANWVLLNRMQADMLNKIEIEKESINENNSR